MAAEALALVAYLFFAFKMAEVLFRDFPKKPGILLPMSILNITPTWSNVL